MNKSDKIRIRFKKKLNLPKRTTGGSVVTTTHIAP